MAKQKNLKSLKVREDTNSIDVHWVDQDGKNYRACYGHGDKEFFKRDLGESEANKHLSKINWDKKPENNK